MSCIMYCKIIIILIVFHYKIHHTRGRPVPLQASNKLPSTNVPLMTLSDVKNNNYNCMDGQNLLFAASEKLNLNRQRKTDNHLNLNSRTNSPIKKTRYLKLDNGHIVRVLSRVRSVHHSMPQLDSGAKDIIISADGSNSIFDSSTSANTKVKLAEYSEVQEMEKTKSSHSENKKMLKSSSPFTVKNSANSRHDIKSNVALKSSKAINNCKTSRATCRTTTTCSDDDLIMAECESKVGTTIDGMVAVVAQDDHPTVEGRVIASVVTAERDIAMVTKKSRTSVTRKKLTKLSSPKSRADWGTTKRIDLSASKKWRMTIMRSSPTVGQRVNKRKSTRQPVTRRNRKVGRRRIRGSPNDSVDRDWMSFVPDDRCGGFIGKPNYESRVL